MSTKGETEGAAVAVCPIPASEDKLAEAHYFLHRMLEVFHEPHEYRWNLNAYLQALRSIEWLLKKELKKRDGSDAWIKQWLDRFTSDTLLRRLVKGRNLLVHEAMLTQRSAVHLGVYVGDRLTMGLATNLDVNVPSRHLLVTFIRAGGILGNVQHDDGEQLGIERSWIVDELSDGPEDVTDSCARALGRVSECISAAHTFCGYESPSIPEEADIHSASSVNILFESDLTAPERTKARRGRRSRRTSA